MDNERQFGEILHSLNLNGVQSDLFRHFYTFRASSITVYQRSPIVFIT